MNHALKHAAMTHPLKLALGVAINMAGYWALAGHW